MSTCLHVSLNGLKVCFLQLWPFPHWPFNFSIVILRRPSGLHLLPTEILLIRGSTIKTWINLDAIEKRFPSPTKVVLLVMSRALAPRLWATTAFWLKSQPPLSTTRALPFTMAGVTPGGSKPSSHSVVDVPRFTSGYFTWTRGKRQHFRLSDCTAGAFFSFSSSSHIVACEIQFFNCK